MIAHSTCERGRGEEEQAPQGKSSCFCPFGEDARRKRNGQFIPKSQCIARSLSPRCALPVATGQLISFGEKRKFSSLPLLSFTIHFFSFFPHFVGKKDCSGVEVDGQSKEKEKGEKGKEVQEGDEQTREAEEGLQGGGEDSMTPTWVVWWAATFVIVNKEGEKGKDVNLNFWFLLSPSLNSGAPREDSRFLRSCSQWLTGTKNDCLVWLDLDGLPPVQPRSKSSSCPWPFQSEGQKMRVCVGIKRSCVKGKWTYFTLNVPKPG